MAIVKMRRVYLLALRQEQDALLRLLLHLGCVELHTAERGEDAEIWERFKGERSRLSRARGDYHTLSQAAEHMKACGVSFPLLQKRRAVSEAVLLDSRQLKKALSGAAAINAHAQAMELDRREMARLEERCGALEHWRDCPIQLDTAGTEHTVLQFGTLPAKADFGEFSLALENTAESEAFQISVTKERRYAVVLCHRESWDAAQTVLHAHGFRPASFQNLKGTAEEAIESARREYGALEEDERKRRELIASYANRREDLELALDQAHQYLMLEEAKERGLSDGTVVLLQGWMPAEREKQVQKALEGFACAFHSAEPTAGDEPPTLLKNPKWMAPINVVTEMYSLPVYRGIDPNPLIFWFYIFFFGFMFADVAYGLILLAIALFVIRKWDPRGAVGQLMHLGVYLGISTFLCGIFTGGFFGNAIEVIAQTFFSLPMTALPLWVQRFSAGFVFSPLTSPMAVLYATLLIGVVQLVFGQLVHIYMEARDGHPLAGLMDTVPWWVFFAGIGVWLFQGSAALFLLGVLLLILTQGRTKHGFWAKLAGGVASLYGVTNWLSDVLSYSRLMALMLATSVIATVINTLGALPGSLIAFIPVFAIGHLFNIAVNLIGTYVHAARLQYLEFYGKFYKEGGIPFQPLTYQTKYTDVIKEEK